MNPSLCGKCWVFLILLCISTPIQGQSEYKQYCCLYNSEMCFNQSAVCDGHFDCLYHEDELDCNYDYPDFNFGDDDYVDSVWDGDRYCCSSNLTKCIEAGMECDGNYDCPGGDDEFFCDIPSSPECVSQGKLYCAESVTDCVNDDEICDGMSDCPHGSDEFQCHEFCPANCSSCSRLELFCRIHRPWVESDMSDLRFSMPNVKHVSLIGDEDGSTRLTWPEALGNHTTYFLRLVRSGLFERLQISEIGPSDFIDFENLLLLGISRNSIATIPNGTFKTLIHLKELHLHQNNIKNIEPEAFPEDLGLLSLKGNQIAILGEDVFRGMTKLHHLNLQDNRIHHIEDNVFTNLTNLQDLNLENNSISTLNTSTFQGLDNLKYIHLTFNRLTYIQGEAFQHTPKLKYIDLSGNPLRVISPGAFTPIDSLETLLIQSTELRIRDKDVTLGLQDLQLLVADNFGICCLLYPDTECKTPPSAFATCEGIFRTPLLRASAWIVSLCALVGNLIVLIMRINNKRMIRGVNLANIQNRFIANLAVADLLMGLYLFILAISDASFGSDYFLHSEDWRGGAICKIIGFIGVLSSISSVLILTIVTLDRFLCVVFPFGKVHFHSTSAYVTIAVVWSVATVFALTPVLLADTLDGFYGLSDVCLGLPLVTDAKELTSRWILDDLSGYEFEFVESEERQGWLYSRFLFIYFNSICVCVIIVCYIAMFFSVRKSARLSKRNETANQEVTMAIRMSLIVGTDMLCWVPIIILGIISHGDVEIPVSLYAWIVIFILPINSALNPFIFTFSSLKRRRKRPQTSMSMEQSTIEQPKFSFARLKTAFQSAVGSRENSNSANSQSLPKPASEGDAV